MGLGMAQRLLAAGHDLRVYNRTGSKAAELERAGAKLCGTTSPPVQSGRDRMAFSLHNWRREHSRSSARHSRTTG
jgi:3-hydroxyisobutyrate dehydrogenase-like beta-hydroxyacid dehydrogenase